MKWILGGVTCGALCLAPQQPEPEVPAVSEVVEKGLAWLAVAQQESGGWGGGSHSAQHVRDPHAVATDPGTTAFTALALLRAGSSPTKGPYQQTVRRATTYLLQLVEVADDKGPQISAIAGTQPQAKMGRYVDTALAAQFFSRLLPELADRDPRRGRVTQALAKCLRKIQVSQSEDGSWSAGGWAPVLQSSLMCNALEQGEALGLRVDADALKKARDYQKGQVDETTGKVDAGSAAGIALYSSAGNMRAVASQAKAAQDLIQRAKDEGRVEADQPVSEATLRQAGIAGDRACELEQSFQQNEAAKRRAFDDELLTGFGNNGGEEFLSYMMKSESLVIDGGEEWDGWYGKMSQRLARIQNNDGSWSGHHCITSPVFCTAAVILTLTAERDAPLLAKAAQRAVAVR